jgi:glycosyltransferase involved in cell wall biosynthesis
MVSEHADPAAALGGADAGGQNVHVAALARELAGRGHPVTVYTRRSGPGQAAEAGLCPGVTVRRLRAGPVAPLPKDELLPHMDELGDRLGREWRRCPPDLVHAHYWMSGLAALRGAGGTGVPVVQTFHALGTVKARYQGPNDTSPAGRIDAERRVGLQCDQVIATCGDEVAELRAMGIPAAGVSVVPCGVDTSVFTPAGAGTRARAGRPRLLMLGRLVERKGTEDVIAALARLPGAELVVAGGPPRAELRADPEYRRLRGAARAHGVAGRVVFTGGVARERVPALIRSADVVVCAPWYEPFGIVPLEAMACGVPVVATAVGGLTDSIVPGRTGLLVPPRDPAALAGAVAALLADPVLGAALGRAGRRRARHWYDWARVAAQTETVYLRLAGAPRSGRAAAGRAAAGAAR